MNRLHVHREAIKERQALPAGAALQFAEIEEALTVLDVHARGLTRKREQGWGRRTMLVGGAHHAGTTYRIAWEVLSRTEVVVWAYGSHEGFYAKLARRARQ
jgi:hypothetical protein